MSSISILDKQVIWHPFTHLKYAADPIHIVKGDGVYLFDDNGEKYIDAFSSWWVNLHGHANKYIADKIYLQALGLEQVAFSNFTHSQAVTFANRLLKHLPENQSKIFYSDNGSTSVEVALKMALQYHLNIGKSKTRILALENGYHGDTFGGMSVASRNVFNHAFNPLLFDVTHIPVPLEGKKKDSLAKLEQELKRGDVCAFIFEPLVQGAGGMIIYPPEALNSMIALCKKYNCLTIADEVMTGFYRTGKFFATDYIDQKPDIICMSKGITGGFLPLGATSCSEQIFNAFISDDKANTFYHGHSYTANPLACAAANASLDLLEKEETQKQIIVITEFFKRMQNKLKNHSALTDIRQIGTILALELKSHEGTSYLNPLSERIAKFYLEHGIIVRPLGNVLYFIPPYCISETELKLIETCTDKFLKSLV